jgi:DNA-binding transcriptional LysR family regulator
LDLTARVVDLVAKTIARIQPMLVAAPCYLQHAPALTRPEQLEQHMCIRVNARDSGSRWKLSNRRSGATQVVPVQGRFAIASVSLNKKLALQGAGIAIIDQALVQGKMNMGQLVQVLPQWSLLPVDLHLLTPSRLMPARVRLFGEMLIKALPGTTK